MADYGASKKYKKKGPGVVTADAPDPFGHVAALQSLRVGQEGGPGTAIADRSWEAASVEPVRSGGVSRLVAPSAGMPGASQVPQVGAPGQADLLGRLMSAIKTKESSGNYNALGIQTKYGRAKGAYQFLPSTYAGFAKQVGVDPGDWSPAAQDKVAAHAMGTYLKQFGGDVAKVAQAWYAGPASVGKANTTRRQNGGQMPSISDYARAIAKMVTG